MTLKEINKIMKLATKAEKDEIQVLISPTERQEQIFNLKYVQKKSISYIADTLFISKRQVGRELKEIRDKVKKIL